MNRNLKILLLIFLALLTITLIVVLKSGKSTIGKAQGHFSVADTAAISEIKIVRLNGKSVSLQRVDNKWFVERNTIVKADLPPILLKVLHDIDHTKILSKSESAKMLKTIDAEGYHITVMSKRRKMADFQYYFDGDNCYAVKGERVFGVSVAGYSQLLGILKLTSTADWRSNVVFAINPQDVSQIIFNNELQPENSFSVRREGRNFELLSYPIGLKMNNIDEEKLYRYVGQFRNKTYVDVAQLSALQIDSLKRSKPMFSISIINTTGQEFWCKAYEKHIADNQLDYDNFYLRLNSGEFVVTKYFEFDPLIKKLDYFILGRKW